MEGGLRVDFYHGMWLAWRLQGQGGFRVVSWIGVGLVHLGCLWGGWRVSFGFDFECLVGFRVGFGRTLDGFSGGSGCSVFAFYVGLFGVYSWLRVG